jgi:C-terminal processing protease CtpA/Prc
MSKSELLAASVVVLFAPALFTVAPAITPCALPQTPAGDSVRIRRLEALARLWAAVTYFHPYFAYRDDINWDAATVKAIAKANTARSAAEYSAAVAGMLNALGDPMTRVIDTPGTTPEHPVSSAERPPTFEKMDDGIVVVDMTNYSDSQNWEGTIGKLKALKKELSGARAVVFDLRPAAAPSESEQGMASLAFAASDLPGTLTPVPIDLPSERRRMHLGYASQFGNTWGIYSSGLYVQNRPTIEPEAGARGLPVVFLLDPKADLPDVALGLQASGKGAIVSEGAINGESAVSTQVIELTDGVRAIIRLGELVYADGSSGFSPNLTVPASNERSLKNAAFQAALQLARTGQFPPPIRTKPADRASAIRDNTYADEPYPKLEYRVLAAFRIWAVVDYFFPYKDLMGVEWNETLRQFIPRMEAAKDALDYNLTVAEMVTNVHDSHASSESQVLRDYIGEASLPLLVRMVEGLPVITGFSNAPAANEVGLKIGDVILKVDGEDANQRMQERLKYIPHSTPEGGMRDAALSLVRGAEDSTATLTIRDVHDQVREVKVRRKAEYLPKTRGDRIGDVMRILPGNVGYADLDRLEGAQVDEMFDKFKECAAIVFDMRGYPHETAWQIAPRLTEKANVVAAMLKRRDPMAPNLPNGDLFSSQGVTTFLQRLPSTDKWRYPGRTVMLIDERTQSQAEHTGLFLESAYGTKFIGSPTAGANGNATYLSVPGGIHIRFTGLGVFHADGRQLQRVGLQPDIAVRPTLAGIRAGRDEVLDRAIEYLRHNSQ